MILANFKIVSFNFSRKKATFTQRSSYRVTPSCRLMAGGAMMAMLWRVKLGGILNDENSVINMGFTLSGFLQLPRPSSRPTSKIAESLQENKTSLVELDVGCQ